MSLTIHKNILIDGKHELPIVADFFYNESLVNQPMVVFCHGYKGFKDWGAWPLMLKSIAKKGYFVIAFNFSHNGGTPENPIDFPDLNAFGNDNFSKQQDDLQSVIDAVTSTNFKYASYVNPNAISLIGHSRGGGAVIIKTANESKISKLITLAAINTYQTSFPKGEQLEAWKKAGVWYVTNGRTKQEMPHYIQFYNDYIANKKSLDIAKSAKEIKVPHLIVHGISDTSVTIESAKELKKLNPNAETFFLNTDHVFGAKHPWGSTEMPNDLNQVTQQILSFLEQ